MANMFRLLKANEVDARINRVTNNGVSLLLYKDARCDQNILDETVGPFNWKREHSRDNANCTVSIWDDVKGQWISKEDTGTESRTEKEKGLASDSFKRACFNWGIGRELYSAPFIWVNGKPDDLKDDRFSVKEIGYDENREINRLRIVNKNNTTVFDYTTRLEDLLPKDPPPADDALAGKTLDNPKKIPPKKTLQETIDNWCDEHGITKTRFYEIRQELVDSKQIPNIRSSEMNNKDFEYLTKAVERVLYE